METSDIIPYKLLREYRSFAQVLRPLIGDAALQKEPARLAIASAYVGAFMGHGLPNPKGLTVPTISNVASELERMGIKEEIAKEVCAALIQQTHGKNPGGAFKG